MQMFEQNEINTLFIDKEPILKLSEKKFQQELNFLIKKNVKNYTPKSLIELKKEAEENVFYNIFDSNFDINFKEVEIFENLMKENNVQYKKGYNYKKVFIKPFINSNGNLIKKNKNKEKQRLYITAGLVGAGKTTTKRLLPFFEKQKYKETLIVDIDIDEYRQYFKGEKNDIQKVVSKLGSNLRNYATQNGYNTCCDCTLGNKYTHYYNLIHSVLDNGGEVLVSYTYVSLQTSIERMIKRAKNINNSRDYVPLEVIEKTHKSSLANFRKLTIDFDKKNNIYFHLFLNNKNNIKPKVGFKKYPKETTITPVVERILESKYIWNEKELNNETKNYDKISRPFWEAVLKRYGESLRQDGRNIQFQNRKRETFGKDETSKFELSQESGRKRLINNLYDKLKKNEKIGDNTDFIKFSEKYLGDRFSGNYDIQYLYNLLEVAINKYIIENNKNLLNSPIKKSLALLNEKINLLPTQTIRTSQKDELQQFSTPPALAFAAIKALDFHKNDIILEPSAGNGGLVSFLQGNVQKIYTNEIDKNRLSNLKFLGFKTTSYDAAIINSCLDPQVKPTAIIMNPPFSATGGRVARHDNKFGFRHIKSALERLEKNGRLVAILSEGMHYSRSEAQNFWSSLFENYTVQSSLIINGKNYRKYGTNFGVSLTTIDKKPNLEKKLPVLLGEYEKIEDAINEIEKIQPKRTKETNYDPFDRGNGQSRQSNNELGGRQRQVSEMDKTTRNNDFTRRSSYEQSTTQLSIFGNPIERKLNKTERSSTVNNIRFDRTNDNEIKSAPFNYTIQSNPNKNLKEIGSFIEYIPSWLPNSSIHPGSIVETKSMSGITMPKPTYIPDVPVNILENISSLQMENVIYAGQRHEKFLPNNSRAGFFIGDGTGLGKGRTIATIITDNFNKDRKRALWVSVSKDLKEAAQTDFNDIGSFNIPCFILNNFNKNEKININEGVLFCTYQALISGKSNYETSRLKQIVDWLGDDGVIVFDEAHKAKNMYSGERGAPSQTGIAVWELQEKYLPKARVVYSSATGATTPSDIGYATRLGLWGEGTYFDNYESFLNNIGSKGVGAMEMIARDMKALGMYSSRSISFEGIEYFETIHELTEEQVKIYDATAKAWQTIMKNMKSCKNIIGADKKDIRDSLKAFWGAHQKFYKKLTTSMKVPTAIKKIEKELQKNRSIIVSIINTYEETTEAEVAKAIANGTNLSEIDITPRATIADFLYRSFPVDNYEKYTNENGNEQNRKIVDAQGNPIPNPEAVKVRDKMIDELSLLNIPESPLDQIINYFNLKAKNENDPTLRVAELTGRKKRLENEISKDKEGNFYYNGNKKYVKRVPKNVSSASQNLWEMKNFQSGEKRIAIISKAASTGISLHSSNSCKNKQQRYHLTLEFGWSADEQLQTFGRSHRSDQKYPPVYDLICTNIGGEKRFISIIANRLSTLGAMTRGDRRSASGGDLNKYDFMSKYGVAALYQLYSKINKNRPSFSKMGLIDSEGNIKKNILSNVSLFLNRLLMLEIREQNKLFEDFFLNFKNTIFQAKEEGKFDVGLVDINALSIQILDRKIIKKDKNTGAETIFYTLKMLKKVEKLSWDKIKNFYQDFYVQNNSKKIVAYDSIINSTNTTTGEVFKKIKYMNPNGNVYSINEKDFLNKYTNISFLEAKKLWNEEFFAIKNTKEETMFLIGGTTLPIYKEIESEKLRVVRVETDNGQRIVGIKIPKNQLQEIMEKFDIKKELKENEIPEILETLKIGQKIELGSNYYFETNKYLGRQLIELKNTKNISPLRFEFLRKYLINEKDSNWKQRFFLSTDKTKAITALREIIKKFGLKNCKNRKTL